MGRILWCLCQAAYPSPLHPFFTPRFTNPAETYLREVLGRAGEQEPNLRGGKGSKVLKGTQGYKETTIGHPVTPTRLKT